MQIPWRSLPLPPSARPVRAPRRPLATAFLLALLLAGAAAQGVLRRVDYPADPLLDGGALTVRSLAAGRWWTPLTHLFLIVGPASLFFVSGLMLALAGRTLEARMGRRHLASLFLLAGLAGGLSQLGFDALMQRETRVAGSSSATLGVLLALACLAPKTTLFPWVGLGVLRRVKVLHAALGALAVVVLTVTRSPAAGALVGGLTGCVYVHALGFARREPEPAAIPTVVAPTPISAASSASWPDGRVAEPLPMASAPAQEARPGTLAPRFTERERRMTPREFVAEKVDPVLEKISRDGLASLTQEERQLLEKAREKMTS